jgi:glucokinase
MSSLKILGFDIGGTKIAWGLVDEEGKIHQQGHVPTPPVRDEFLKTILSIITKHKPDAVGIGIAGTVSADHQDVVVSPHLPELSHFELVQTIQEKHPVPIALDNDARCALIGEVWKGKAQNVSSAVLITLGTGVGGAVMQKEVVLPHPHDITQEIGYLTADPDDLFPASSGKGSIEALLGGENLEDRFGIPVGDLVARARKEDPEALEIFKTISYYFIQSVRAIFETYNCKLILVGGKGNQDLDLYLRDIPPCPVEAAGLGELAGVIGAARLGLDLYEQEQEEIAEWGDEEEKEGE